MKRFVIGLVVLVCMSNAVAYEIGACTSRTPFTLDIQAGTRTVEMGAVKALSYDNKWQMPAATVMRLFVNGEAVSDLEGVNAYGWQPQRPGTYALGLRSYVDGVLCEEVLTAGFEVKGRDIVNAEVRFDEAPILYDGTGKEPHPTVVCDGKTLVEGMDYTLSWENNVNAGVGKVVIKGIGAYSDEVEKAFTIVPAGICSLNICAGPRFPDFPEKLNYDQAWIGTESGDKYIRIFENGARITQETGVGDYAWTAYDKGLYTLEYRTYVDGYKQEEVYTAQFFIGGGSLTQEGISVLVSPEAFAYDGQPKEPAVAVRFDGVALRQGIDYTVSYEDNIEIGTGYAVVRGIGDYSDEVRKSFTIYGSMGIRAISARQRYPWNGLVDIDCIADGAPDSTYRVTFSAMDMVGGTNLPMRTIWRLGGETNACHQVTPQAYRFVWDAGEDLPDGLKLDQVKISASASEFWANDLVFTVNGYTGASTLSGVPVLVRLSSSVEGFDYAKMAFPESGKDLSFTSPDGETIYPHEIDTWNREGESLIWVRLPSVAKTGTHFKMRYGNPLAKDVEAQSVWSDYAGVWHLGESSSSAKDSTSHALNATAGGSPYTAGACGTARNGEVKAPNYNSLAVGNNFTASGWFRSSAAITAYPKPFYRNESGWANGGWGVEFSKSATVMTAVGSSNSTCLNSITVPTVVNTWVYLTFVYNGTTATCYANGKSCKSGTIVAAKDNGKPLRIAVSGLLSDEVRLRKGTLTADRIKADYDIVANKSFLTVSDPVSRDSAVAEAIPIRIDLKRDGVRASNGNETLVYSGLWDGADNATVAIAQNGVALFENLEGEGVKTWSVNRSGEYVLTHTTYNGSVAGKVETAVFVVEGKEVPIGELTIDWGQASFVYDGQPKEPVITVKDRETTLTKGTHYLVEYKDNINVGTAKAIVKGIEPYVGEVTNEFTIAAAPIGPGGGEEPGSGVIPEGGLSKFDATYVYDGEGHTINTQALYAVTLVGSTPSFSFSLDGETGWQNDPFVYTNVGEYVMWYKITAPNYADYKHQAKVTIQPLVLTVTFDANGGSCPMASKTVTHGATYGTLPTPTWAGHIFAGWYTAASGGNEVEDSTVVSIMAPQMLYAHWVSVTGVSAKQRYPWNGLVDIVVAFEGESNDVAKVDCSFIATNSATKAALSVASITRKGADSGKDNAWSRQFIWNAGADVGAVKIDDVALVVAARIPVEGGVQLWENGPYWAECNVGATKPEECGYYFMWGDTVGYKRNGESWDAVDGSKTGFSFDFGKCATFGEDISSLVRGGYVDLTGNLVAAYDAATAFLGAPWRMPTDAELSAIIDNCKILWTTQNRVCGCLVIGKGAYSSSRIFLPAAGYGSSSNLRKMDEVGFYWSSTLDSGDSTGAGEFGFNSEKSYHDNGRRELGQSIRPLRDPAASSVCVSKLHLSLDCRTGDRVSAGTEELTFSNLWDGDADATVTIAQDGAAIFTGLTGEGVKTWTVDRNGRYVLTHTTYKNGVKGKVETAVFVVEGKEVPVGELTIDWGQSSFVYDGQPKEPVITVKDRGTTLTKGTHYLVEYKDNINVGTAKAIVKGIEPYVGEMTNAFTITKGTLPPENPPDPIDPDPDDPQKPFSAFDYVGVYDGEGHTIDTNGLVEAFAAVVGGGFTVSYAIGESGGSGGPALPWTTVAPVFTNAATNVVWYKVSSANYADIVHAAKVAITKRAITVASVGATWTYDTTAHGTNEVKVALSASGQETASPFPAGEGIEIDETSFPTITDVGEKDNAFTWTFAEGTLAGNYDAKTAFGKLKVEARTIGDDPANWDIRLDKAPMYNGEVQSAPIIQVCYVKPDGNLDYIPYTLAGNVATDAGNYKVKISGTGNYTGTVEKDWAIMPRNLKLTSGTAEWMYDGTTHVTNVIEVTGDGFAPGEGATYEGFPEVLHVADAAEPVENAFTYKLNDNTKAKNYEIVTEKGTVRMTKRPISLTAPTKSKTYDGTPLTFAAGEIEIGGKGYAEGEAFTFSNFASITEAGQAPATFTIADGTALMADYDITVAPGATLTVQKSASEITVTAKNGTWVYDGEEHKLHEYEATNLGTLVGGDRLEVTFAEQSVVTTPVDGENQDGVVENAITSVKVMRGEVDVSGNYTLAWYPGTLTVTKRPVTLTSKSASKTYDGSPLTRHEVDVGGDGFAGEDGATYTYTGTRTDKGKGKNTFEYALKSGTKAAYYEITKVEGDLEVTAADISAGADEDWEIVLGPALTYNGIAQIQTLSSVKFKGLDVDYSVTGNQQTDAGSYEMTLAGQGNFTGTKTVAWSIAPKPLTLTAGRGSKPYDGTPLTSNAVTAEGFVAGESATYACTGSQLDVGSSANVVTTIDWTGAKAGNYAVTKKPGVLSVVPLAVTVKSKNISKPFDGTPLKLTTGDIELSCGVPGGHAIPAGESFVYGDFAERIEAGQTSATFTVAAGANTKLTNYAITPVYGTITITKSATEIGVTARSKSWPYDAATHELHEYDATNLNILQPGEELVVTFKASSKVTTPKDGPDADGKVANEIETIRIVKNGSQDVTDNYTVTLYPGVLAVTKRPVTVTVKGKTISATYDGEEHTASGYDIATEDELYDIAAKTSFGGTDEVTRTDAGKSQMGLKPSDFTNSDEYFDVTYAVTDGWVSVAQADISAGEEGDFVLTLGANPKYNGTVQTIPVTAVTYRDLPVTYTLAGENATHAGTYTLTVKANGNFKGERSTTWRILKRQVKLTSGSASRAYDATPLANGEVAVSGDGFIGLEGATFEVTGAQTDVGSSKNAFTYALKAGTLAGDYEIATEQGDLTVTPRAVTLISASASKVYDATPLVKDAVSVKTGSLGFAGAEGFAATCSGTITAVGTTPNSFTYTLTNGAKAGNYAITTEYGTLTVTKATLDVGSVFPGFETCTEEDGFACTRVYNGKAQPFEVEVAESFAEEYEFLYAVTPGAWSPVAPTRTSVAEGALKVYFRFVSPNFEPYEGYGTLRIVEKEITDEMVQPGEDAFFFDGADKKPTVDVIYEVDGQDICTTNDYTLVYGEKAAAGWWVTVTGKGNYAGTVAKIVPVLKRPVAPPIVPSRSYNGKAQKPTIPTDSRWTTVSNPGGIDVGEYSNVVLRLTNTTDYKWKGGAEDQTDITLVFKVTKGNNGWSRQPDMKGWAYGETPSEPSMGQARYGTVQVAYRKEGADVSTETATRPELPGRYVARFWVDETENFIGVAVHEPYKDIAFEITGSAPGGTETTTTPVPVPHDWLDAYVAEFGGGDYETAANAKGRNGVSLWESYVAGLDPTDAASQFTAIITMGADGKPVITWQPDLRTANPPRTYVEYGKANLGDKDWTPVTDANRAAMRFFKVGVEIK